MSGAVIVLSRDAVSNRRCFDDDAASATGGSRQDMRQWVGLHNDRVSPLNHCRRLHLKAERNCDRKWQRDEWSWCRYRSVDYTTSTAAAVTTAGLEMSGMEWATVTVRWRSGRWRRSRDRMETQGSAELIYLSTLLVALLCILSGTLPTAASSPGRHDSHTWPGSKQ